MTQKGTLRRNIHFSFRATAEAVFVAQTAARIEGRSVATFVEAATSELAKRLKLPTGKTVQDYWDEHEGISWCMIYLDKLFAFDEEENRQREFVMAHQPFFFRRVGRAIEVNKRATVVLWGDIDRLVDDYHKRKTIDPWATGERMRKMLESAKLPAPEWGPGNDEV